MSRDAARRMMCRREKGQEIRIFNGPMVNVAQTINGSRVSHVIVSVFPRLNLLKIIFWDYSCMSTDQPHKAHRPAQSGAKADKKGKGKQKSGFNEKVCIFLFSQSFTSYMSHRPSHRNLVETPIVKVVETLNETKHASMFP
jgi:hypothetical protein